jgi:hypothetical protein
VVTHVRNEAVHTFVIRLGAGSESIAEIACDLRSLVER